MRCWWCEMFEGEDWGNLRLVEGGREVWYLHLRGDHGEMRNVAMDAEFAKGNMGVEGPRGITFGDAGCE